MFVNRLPTVLIYCDVGQQNIKFDIGLFVISSIASGILWYQLYSSVRETLVNRDTKSVTCKT
jgi:hypothetical protein